MTLFEYEKTGKYFAQVTGKMEEFCADELVELGAENVTTVYRGVHFEATKEILYKINYTSRLITRVLAPIAIFRCRSTEQLTFLAKGIAWERLLSLNKNFAISCTVSHSRIKHSKYASLCLKDAIADYFTVKEGKRPNVETKNPDVRINLRIEHDLAIISLDTSGESLHKRGYRLSKGEAPMQETLAAAIVRLSGWKGDMPLWDCMCGSGTILCEALMSYCNVPAQYLRKKFGFENLPDFDKKLWGKVKSDCDSQIKELPDGMIKGSDRDEEMIKVSRENLRRLPLGNKVELVRTRFQDAPEFEDGILITNPPYGIRLGTSSKVKELYTELGDFIKHHCHGTTSYIYTGDPVLRKFIGLKISKKIPMVNGKLEGILMQIDSFKGRYKERFLEKNETDT